MVQAAEAGAGAPGARRHGKKGGKKAAADKGGENDAELWNLIEAQTSASGGDDPRPAASKSKGKHGRTGKNGVRVPAAAHTQYELDW